MDYFETVGGQEAVERIAYALEKLAAAQEKANTLAEEANRIAKEQLKLKQWVARCNGQIR